MVSTFTPIAQNIGHATPLEAEICPCMFAVEKAFELQLKDIWIETDSLGVVGVVKACNHHESVPWRMKARWHNCMSYCKQNNCTLTYVLRQGNLVADALAKNGQNMPMHSSHWWDHPLLLWYLCFQGML